MPIKDLTDSVRLPRLGKIHLGIKHPEKGYPMKTDYFVLPKDHSDYKKLVAIFGEKPKALRILIPVEDDEVWATQYYKAYNQTYGLLCKGNGETALRLVDIETKGLATQQSKSVVLLDIDCKGKDCPEYQTKKCHEVMNLRFLIPEVPGLGVWQIDTGSKNSILNINSCALLIRRAFGHISMIPLLLTLEPAQVNNPQDSKKQTVYVLHLQTDVTLAQLRDQAKEQAKMLKIGMPDMEEEIDLSSALEGEYQEQVQKDIDELWGEPEKETTGEITDGESPSEKKPLELKEGGSKPPPEPTEASKKQEQTPSLWQETTLAWIKETLPIIGWKPANAMSWIKTQLGVEQDNRTLSEVIKSLSQEDLDKFVKHIQVMRKSVNTPPD